MQSPGAETLNVPQSQSRAVRPGVTGGGTGLRHALPTTAPHASLCSVLRALCSVICALCGVLSSMISIMSSAAVARCSQERVWQPRRRRRPASGVAADGSGQDSGSATHAYPGRDGNPRNPRASQDGVLDRSSSSCAAAQKEWFHQIACARRPPSPTCCATVTCRDHATTALPHPQHYP